MPSWHEGTNREQPLAAYQRLSSFMFFDLYSVTQSVPNGFSMADLEAMLEDAPTDVTDVCPDCGEENKLTDREKLLVERAEQVLDGASEGIASEDAPILHKIMVQMIITHMVEWHSRVAENHLDDPESAIGWARDAGKFQAVMNILTTISVANDDFTCIQQ